MNIWIWRDSLDPDMYSIGTLRNQRSFVVAGQMHIDGIRNVFGSDVANIVAMSDEAREFTVTAEPT